MRGTSRERNIKLFRAGWEKYQFFFNFLQWNGCIFKFQGLFSLSIFLLKTDFEKFCFYKSHKAPVRALTSTVSYLNEFLNVMFYASGSTQSIPGIINYLSDGKKFRVNFIFKQVQCKWIKQSTSNIHWNVRLRSQAIFPCLRIQAVPPPSTFL